MTAQTEHDIGRIVYFEPNETGNWAYLHFAIEPPIHPHSDDFLNKEVQNAIYASENNPEKNYKCGNGNNIELVKDIELTHSDEKATYGHLYLRAGEDRIEDTHHLITDAFTRALNPLGRSALAFVFGNEDKIPE
jgi:hypothetical protein